MASVTTRDADRQFRFSWRHPIIRNAMSLYGARLAGYLLPLVTVPYLARVLHPAGLGLVVYGQSFALWMALIVEYGFNFSATREVARHRDEPSRLAQIVADVMGAKLLLVLLVCGITLLIWKYVPIFRQHPAYLLLGLLYAVCSGLTPFWFYQGIERLVWPSVLDIGTRALAAVGVFLWIHTPAHGWIALALQAGGSVLSASLLLAALRRRVAFPWPGVRRVTAALRDGWYIFVFRSVNNLCTLTNIFLLGLLMTPVHVGYYGGVVKLVGALLGLQGPISQALYPRITYLTQHDPARAARMTRASLLLMATFGIVTCLIVAAFAPFWIHLLLGARYAAATPILRLMALEIPIIAVGDVLGIQRMLPRGMDKQLSVVTLAGLALDVALVFLLVPAFHAPGMAGVEVITTLMITLGLYVMLKRK